LRAIQAIPRGWRQQRGEIILLTLATADIIAVQHAPTGAADIYPSAMPEVCVIDEHGAGWRNQRDFIGMGSAGVHAQFLPRAGQVMTARDEPGGPIVRIDRIQKPQAVDDMKWFIGSTRFPIRMQGLTTLSRKRFAAIEGGESERTAKNMGDATQHGGVAPHRIETPAFIDEMREPTASLFLLKFPASALTFSSHEVIESSL